MVGLTIDIKLRFQISLAKCEGRQKRTIIKENDLKPFALATTKKEEAKEAVKLDGYKAGFYFISTKFILIVYSAQT